MLSMCINILLLYSKGWMVVNTNRQNTENLKEGFLFSLLVCFYVPYVRCTWAKSVISASFKIRLDHTMINPVQAIRSREEDKKKNKRSALAPSNCPLGRHSLWLPHKLCSRVLHNTTDTDSLSMHVPMATDNTKIMQMFNVGKLAKGKV